MDAEVKDACAPRYLGAAEQMRAAAERACDPRIAAERRALEA